MLITLLTALAISLPLLIGINYLYQKKITIINETNEALLRDTFDSTYKAGYEAGLEEGRRAEKIQQSVENYKNHV